MSRTVVSGSPNERMGKKSVLFFLYPADGNANIQECLQTEFVLVIFLHIIRKNGRNINIPLQIKGKYYRNRYEASNDVQARN